jgi:hypothetical protein
VVLAVVEQTSIFALIIIEKRAKKYLVGDLMHENHAIEQYFWDEPTLDWLAQLVEGLSSSPCCLCAPMLGKKLIERGGSPAILDIDERFSDLPGFQKYNIYRPHWIEESYDLIICDPPFWNVRLSQLFTAIRKLAHFDYQQKMLVSYPTRRGSALQAVFWSFGLEPTGIQPKYVTVQDKDYNQIEFLGNI